MKLRIFITVLMVTFGFAQESTFAWDSNRTLIVYLSRTQNTKVLAELIHDEVGGTLVALELLKPYPKDYKSIVSQVSKENESGYLPPLKTVVDINRYDTIFLGFPTWGMQLPPPMKSFLHQYDLSGKTILPFNTNGGYGLGSCIQTITDLCPDSDILEEFTIKGGSERDGVFLSIIGNRKVEVKKQLQKWISNTST